MRCIALAALSPAFHNPSTMNINSRLFDSIRIGASEAEAPVESDAPRCSHPGCARMGEFRAPKGRGREGQFFLFCMEHVKAYNATYNYFAGMDDDALAAYAKQEEIGHRPTWKLGVNSKAARMSQRRPRADCRRTRCCCATRRARPASRRARCFRRTRCA